MGTFQGFALIKNRPQFTAETVRAALSAALRTIADQDLYSRRERLAVLPAVLSCFAGLLTRRVEAWACWDPGRKWLLAGDTALDGGVGFDCAAKLAKAYGGAFQSPVLVMSVADSDWSELGFYDPETGGTETRVAGRCEDGDGLPRRMLSAPDFLLPYLTEKGRKDFYTLWREEQIFEENRLGGLMELLDAPGWYTPQSDKEPPPGATLIRAR